MNFLGFLVTTLNIAYNVFCFFRRCAEVIECFGESLGLYRNETRMWFNEFVFKFWDQCYLLLARPLISKLRYVFIEEFNCFPAQNGAVYDFHNHAPLYA